MLVTKLNKENGDTGAEFCTLEWKNNKQNREDYFTLSYYKI